MNRDCTQERPCPKCMAIFAACKHDTTYIILLPNKGTAKKCVFCETIIPAAVSKAVLE